ncbi:MAG: FctA domain-containing protein [Lachnospiraceae bacterium]|nr:FctA domain-containing protein [Lachnospiraceae bacterium]
MNDETDTKYTNHEGEYNMKETQQFSKRILALFLTLIMVLGIMPASAIAAVGEGEKITAIAETTGTYTVANGTEKEAVGLPSAMEVTIETPVAEEGGQAVTRQEQAAVTWNGSYDGNTAGEYTLQAAFTDDSNSFETMPTVNVTVEEAVKEETMEETPEEEPVQEESNEESGIMTMTDYAPGSPGLVTEITDLSVTPNTDIWPGTEVTINYKWAVGFSGVQNSFKNGDTVRLPHDAQDLFNLVGGWSYNITTAANVEVATMTAEKDAFVITFNQAAEDMGLTRLTGSFLDYFEKPAAKNLDLDSDTTKQFTLAGTSADVGFKGGKKINVLASGSGSAELTSGGTTTMVTNGQIVEITGIADAGETLVSVTLIKTDGTTETLTPGADGKVTLFADQLAKGLTTVAYIFSGGGASGGTAMNEGRGDVKSHWGNYTPTGSILATSARFDVEVGYRGLLGLYNHEGTSLEHRGEANIMTDVFMEDTLPGGSLGKFAGNKEGGGKPKLYALLADYTTATANDGQTKTFPVNISEDGALAQTDLIADGYLAEITQSAGESLDAFRGRVKAMPLSYGIHVDVTTGASTFMVNLGSPGDANGTAIKATTLWPGLLAADAKLNTINGAGNCVGGNVQAFRIDYYGNYHGAPYTLEGLTNYMDVTTTENGRALFISEAYTITGNSATAVPSTGYLTIVKVDAATQAPITGASFKVQVQKVDGSWADYADASGVPVTGLTGADGTVKLGIMTPDTYRIIEESAPAPYDPGTVAYTSAGGASVTADGHFTVVANEATGRLAIATNAKAYTVTYDANGGTGTLADPNSPYAENAAWSPLTPVGSISRDGYLFTGWNTEAGGSGTTYDVGSTYTITGNVTLYAQWKKLHQVKFFEQNGTTQIGTTQMVGDGEHATAPAAPSVPNAIFVGWYVSTGTFDPGANNTPALTEAEVNSAAVTGDINYVAIYRLDTPDSAELSVTGTKHLTGGGKTDADIAAAQFGFTMTQAAGDTTAVTGLPAGEVSVAAGGAIDFGTVTFTAAGDYSFTIHETGTNGGGYTLDTKDVTMNVKVSLDQGINKLQAAVTYTKDGRAASGIAFNNTYSATAGSYTVPAVTKAIKGTPGESKDFTFTIEGATGAEPMPAETSKTISGAGVVGFGAIAYAQAGTYTYEIKETTGSDRGYTYDDSVYTITVKVTDENGQLEAVGTVTKGEEAADAILFTNKYETKPVTVDPPVEKKITGDTPSADETFTFQMKAADSAFPMPEGSENGVKLASVKGSGKVEFGEYTYTKPGTYSYSISEVAGSNTEYAYDRTVYTLTDVVTDVDSTLTVERTITDGDGKAAESAVFTNVYTKPAVEEPTTPTKPGTTTPTKPGTTTTTKPGTTITTTGGKTNVVSKVINNVKTGDPASITLLVILLLAAGGVITVTLKRRKVKK